MPTTKNETEFWLNNVKLQVSPVNIISRQKRRLAKAEYLREASASVLEGKYGEALFTVIIQFSIQEMINTPMTATNPAPLVQVMAQLDNYPFAFIKSDIMKAYLSPTVTGDMQEMMFGIEEFTLSMDAIDSDIVTLSLNLKYFNYSPISTGAGFVHLDTPDEGLVKRTRSIGGARHDKVKPGKTNIRDSAIFNSYFYVDYARAVPKMSAYSDPRYRSNFHLRFPTFRDEKPKGDYERITYTAIDAENKMYQSHAYVQWSYVSGISQLNKRDSPVTGVSITRRNNFASHSMPAWTYPTLQYLGRGTTRVSFSMAINTPSSDALRVVKGMFNKIDINQRSFPQYISQNVLKMDHILFDLVPIYGVTFDSESISASADISHTDIATFSFFEKNVGPLLDRRVGKHANNKSGSYDMGVMVNVLLAISASTFDELSNIPLRRSFAEAILESVPSITQEPTRHRAAKLPKGLTNNILSDIEKHNGLERDTLYNVMYQESVATNSSGPFINTNAKNASSGALGAFQFLKATGEQYGLHDRTDALASATAAGKYLSYLKNRFGSTDLALAAYNWGEGNLKRALAAKGISLSDSKTSPSSAWIVVRSKTPRETQDYVRKISSARKIDAQQSGEAAQPHDVDDLIASNTILRKMAEGVNEAMRSEEQGYDLSKQDRMVQPTLGYMKAIAPYSSARDDKSYAIATRAVEQAFLALLSEAEGGNELLAAHMGLLSQDLYAQLDRLDNAFSGEAYTDLNLGARTLPFGPVLGENGEVADRNLDVNPMFFMYPNPYITESILNKGSRTVLSKLQVNKRQLTEHVQAALVIENSSKGRIESLGRTQANTETEDLLAQRLKDIKVAKVFGKIADDLSPNSIEYMRGTAPLDMSSVGPDAGPIQSRTHFKRASSTFSRGMNLAFPVIKVFLVDGDEDTLRHNIGNPIHGFYELSGIMAAKIIGQDDLSPVDVLYLRLANPGSVYTDHTVLMDELHAKKDWEARDTNFETSIPLNRIVIRSGTRLHVKAGYSNDINKLETLFNGIVTEVSGSATLEVIAESFGRELISVAHGHDPQEDNFSFGADTAEVVANFLNSSEIAHFGDLKLRGKLVDLEGSPRAVFTLNNFYKYVGSEALFMNVFLGNVVPDFDLLSTLKSAVSPLDGKKLWPHFPIYRTTPWSAFKEMEFRHPGALARACHYGDRHTLFFGVKEQLYVYRDLNTALQTSQASEELRALVRDKRLKPVADFHILSSDLNIIYNGLRVTSDFKTVVSVRYFNDTEDFKNQDFEWYDMKLDDNLKPLSHRLGRCELLGVDGKFTSYSYGSTYLRKEVEKMYDGRIIVLGMPNIKSGDYAVIDDANRGMNGIIKVRECIHHFDTDNGFVTEITPGLMAESTHVDHSMLFTRLYMSYMPVIMAARQISISSSTEGTSVRSLNEVLDTASALSEAYKPFSESFTAIPILLETAVRTALSAYIHAEGVQDKIRGIVKDIDDTDVAIVAGGATAAGLVKLAAPVTWDFIAARAALMSSSILVNAGGLLLGALNIPTAIVAGLLVTITSSLIEETQLTRQPVRMFPITLNNKPYVGGIWGYNSGEYLDDTLSNIDHTLDSISTIASAIWSFT